MESDELIAILNEVRERVRAQRPSGDGGGRPPLDLMPLVHARDAALGKVAAIGSVNPRPGGLANTLIQAWKRLLARVLDWHVREQVEFNRQVMACLDGVIEALNDANRELAVVPELRDMRSHWSDWRLDWERKLQQNEIQFLRSVADLQGAFQHRTTLMDASYRDAVRTQHAEFTAALDRSAADVQKRLWADLDRIQRHYEGIIHAELRTLRQRAQIRRAEATSPEPADTAAPLRPASPEFDSGAFAQRFRGTEEYVRKGQQFYVPLFTGKSNVLDLGCGRGEFLETMGAAGIPARGVDLGAESVALCRHKKLDARQADIFEHLEELPEASLDGIFCAQVVEHLPPERVPELIRLCGSRLERGGVIAIETPNPECLAIFATHFFLDPTHTRPVPHPLLAFYLEEAGFGGITVTKLSPALESHPSLAALPEDFRNAFFGGLDYAVTAIRV